MTYSQTTHGVASFDLAQELASLQTLLLNSSAIPLSPYALVNRDQLLQQILRIQSALAPGNNGEHPQPSPDSATLLTHIQQAYDAAAASLAQGYATQLADREAQVAHYRDQVMFLRAALDTIVQEPLVMSCSATIPQE